MAMLLALLCERRCGFRRFGGSRHHPARHVTRTKPGRDAQAEAYEPALLTGEGHGANDEEGLVTLDTIHEVHDLPVFAADGAIERNFGEVVRRGSLRVSNTREMNAVLDG